MTPPIKFAILATDTTLFTLRDDLLYVRLIPVPHLPQYQGMAAFPGGLISPTESAEDAARRLVRDKACIDPDKVYFEQLYTFSGVERDPRGRVVAVAYLGLVPWEVLSDEERADTHTAWWARAAAPGPFAYDHKEILAAALKRLRTRLGYTTLIAKLMPRDFTLSELERAYACVLKAPLDKRNFRKKILKLGILKALKEKRRKYRPAQLYRFTSSTVEEIEVL